GGSARGARASTGGAWMIEPEWDDEALRVQGGRPANGGLPIAAVSGCADAGSDADAHRMTAEGLPDLSDRVRELQFVLDSRPGLRIVLAHRMSTEDRRLDAASGDSSNAVRRTARSVDHGRHTPQDLEHVPTL